MVIKKSEKEKKKKKHTVIDGEVMPIMPDDSKIVPTTLEQHLSPSTTKDKNDGTEREPRERKTSEPHQESPMMEGVMKREGLILDRLEQLERELQELKDKAESRGNNEARDHGLIQLKFTQLDIRIKANEDSDKLQQQKIDRRKFQETKFIVKGPI